MVAQDEQHEHEEQDGDGVPRELVVDIGCGDRVVVALGSLHGGDIEPVDHHETQDGEQGRDGQEEGIGVGHAPAHDDVCDER